MVMAGLRTGQILERIRRLVGVVDRRTPASLSARAAQPRARPDARVSFADGVLTITGIGDDTDAEALWRAAVAAADERTMDLARGTPSCSARRPASWSAAAG